MCWILIITDYICYHDLEPRVFFCLDVKTKPLLSSKFLGHLIIWNCHWKSEMGPLSTRWKNEDVEKRMKSHKVVFYMTLNSFNSLGPSVAYIFVSKLTIIGSDNGLSPCWCKAIICNNAGILLTEPLGTKFSEIFIESHTFFQENASENVVCEMTAISSRLQCVNQFFLSILNWYINSMFVTGPNYAVVAILFYEIWKLDEMVGD